MLGHSFRHREEPLSEMNIWIRDKESEVMHMNSGKSSIVKEYTELEKEMKRQVDRDNKDSCIQSTYLPCITPKGKVDFIFVAMEPRIERWIPFVKFEELCSRGFVNFIGDMYCATVHYSIWRALDIHDISRYHITDLSKGAMSTKYAEVERNERYNRWKPLLKKEIGILSETNKTQVIAFGGEASKTVREITGEDPLKLLHYGKTCDKFGLFKKRIEKNAQWEQEYAAMDKGKLKKEIVAFNKRKLLPILPIEVMRMEEKEALDLIRSEPGDKSFEPLFMRYFVYQKELQKIKQPLPTKG